MPFFSPYDGGYTFALLVEYMSISLQTLKDDFEVNGEVSFTLSRKESAFLGLLIETWYRINRYKLKHIVVAWLYKLIDRLRWKILMKKSFKYYPKVNEAFRFYILYKGKEQLYINGVTDPSDNNLKNINIISLSKKGAMGVKNEG